MKPIKAGNVQSNIPRRRPMASETNPLSTLPNGCPMNVKLANLSISFVIYHLITTFFYWHLHNHDASDDVILIVSFGFNVILIPSSAGIIIDEEDSTRVLMKANRFFIIVTMT